MRFKSLFYITIISLFIASCGSSKKVVTTKDKDKQVSSRVDRRTIKPAVVTTGDPASSGSTTTDSSVPKNKVEAYVLKFKDVAMKEMELYKIPASITLAQGVLESGSGKGRLAVEANNHMQNCLHLIKMIIKDGQQDCVKLDMQQIKNILKN